jgi:hypothetical protein
LYPSLSGDETRSFAWIDLLEAESRLLLGDHYQATNFAKRALKVFQDLHIVSNIAIITDIYGRLLATPHGKSADVVELGERLRKGMKR